MHHPKNRAERRHERARVIARRKFVHDHIWWQPQIHTDPAVELGFVSKSYRPFDTWGQYAKYNGGCGCKGCHSAKYFQAKDKRRRALKEAESQAWFRKADKVCGKY